MSVYNGNLLTRIHDPVYDSQNFKTEFRLPTVDAVYFSNLRIINAGIESVGGDNLSNGPTGDFSIDSIQLYDGNVMLDQILNATIWKTFKNLNKKNDENMSMELNLSRSLLGYEAVGSQTYSGGNDNYLPESVLATIYPPRDEFGKLGNLSYINLQQLMPFLNSSYYLPTRIFKNLRLVINWVPKGNLKNLVRNRALDENSKPDVALITDELISKELADKVNNQYKGVSWRAIENDSVHVNGVNPTAVNTQSNKFLINGFNNKTLRRLLMVQTPLDQASYVDADATLWGGNQTSVSQLNTQYQFRINGSNKLPRDGFTHNNQRLAELTNTFGEMNLIPFTNYVYNQGISECITDGVERESMGKVDYTACQINERVSEFQLFFNRKGVNAAGNDAINQPLRLNLFGEVDKQLVVDDRNNYTISYV